MPRLDRVFWRAMTLSVAVLVLIGLATQAGTAAVRAGRPARAAVPAHMTLAQRRAQVRRDLQHPRGSRLAVTQASSGRRPSRKDAARGRDSANTPLGISSSVAVVGTDGYAAAVCDAIAPVPSGQPCTKLNGLVVPGEPLTATAIIYNSYYDCTKSGSCPNVYYNVKVTWLVSCNGVNKTYNESQVVSAPDEFTWSPPNKGVNGVPVSLNFSVSASQCSSGPPLGSGNFSVQANTSIVGVSGSSSVDLAEASEQDLPASQVQGCGCTGDSSGEKPAQAYRGDPVDTATGDYAESFTDATLNTPGYPLSVTREYSSGVTASGPLGPGWTMPWFASLSINSSTGNVTFNSEDGSQYLYTSDGGKTYTAPFGARSVLAGLASGDYTLTTPGQDVLTFNSAGQLTSEVDPTGRGLSFTYAAGQLSEVTDAASQSVSLSYAAGLLSQITLPGGSTVSYAYTGGLLTAVTDPEGNVTQYTYNSANLLTSIENPLGNYTVRNTYNSAGQVTSQEDATGAVTTFSYQTENGLQETDVTDPDGGIQTDVYGGNILLESYDPLGNETSFAYDNLLDVTEATDPAGNSTVMTYDDNGNMLTSTDPLGDEQKWKYNSDNSVTSYTNADKDPTTFTYNPMNEPLTVTSPSGGETTFTYNSAGSVVSSVSPLGNVSGANASNYTTTYAYNSSGLMKAATDPDGDTTSYAYTAEGLTSSVADPDGNKTSYTYDADERLAKETAPGGGVTKYAYNAVGNLASQTDSDGNTWTYSYDADARLVKTTDPLGNISASTYDGDSNQVTATDARGVTTTTTFNADNRPLKVTYSDGTPTVTYAYDADGDVTTLAGATGTQTLAYNTADEVTSIAGPGSGSFAYTYDPAGNVLTRSYPDGTAITYTYSSDGEMTSLASGSATTTYTYNVANELTSTAMSNGVTEAQAYNDAGQLTGITDAKGSKTLDSYQLTLDGDAQPTQAAVTQDGTVQPGEYYGYDSDGQLTSACASTTGTSGCSTKSGGGETAWTYDQAGDRLTQVTGGKTTDYAYNADEELVTATTGSAQVAYGYDADGDQTTAGSSTYAYNGAGELSGAGAYSYSYDAAGNLASVSQGGKQVQGTIWDPNNSLPMAAETTGASGASTADYLYGPGGTLASMTTSAGSYNATTDWLGSVTGLVNSSGSQVESTSYSPYGTPTATGSPASSIGYAGSYSLPDSGGLDDMRSRDYNPATGQFTSVDPLLTLTGQPYTYAGNAPDFLTDPSGLCSWWNAFCKYIQPLGGITEGACISTIAGAGIVGSNSDCLDVSVNFYTGNVQVGLTQTPGIGLGMPTLTGGISGFTADAPCLADLQGEFGQVGGSGEFAGYSLGGDWFTGQSPSNSDINGFSSSVGLGVDLPGAAGFEVHGEYTYTYETTLFQFSF
jgi:RHS repeat-associated protein